MTDRDPVRVLIVEDEKLVAMDLKNTLLGLGCQIVGTAANYDDAVAAAAKEMPDIALLDIKIAGEKDGIAVGRHLRDQFDIPCVYLTAHSDQETLARAGVTEPYGYILKPFEERDLQVAIEIGVYKHRAEQRQKQVEGWLASALYGVGDGILATDLNGRVIFVNPTAEAMLGMTHAQAQGIPVERFFRTAYSLNGNAVRDAVQRACKEESVIHPVHDVYLLNRDHEEVPVVFSAAPIRNREGGVTGVVLSCREARSAEEVRLLDGRAAARLAEAQKLEAVGTMATAIAHDFNNILMAMIGNAGLIRMKSGGDRTVSDLAREIESSGARAALLCEQMIGFAREEESEVSPVDLCAMVDTSMDYYLEQLSANVKLLFRNDSGPIVVAANAASLRRVMANIFKNAVEALPCENGLITFTTGMRNIGRDELDQTMLGDRLPPGDYGCLAIENNGAPIPQGVHRRIFDPFFTTRFLGRGLGLSEAYGLMRSMGGAIRVASDDQSTVFELLLPVSDGVRTVEEDAGLPNAETTARRVLLVERNEGKRDILRLMLQQLGYDVIAADDAGEASRLIRQQDVELDAVITDTVLPGADVGELVSDLRAARSGVPVLLMTGLMDRRARETADRLQASAILAQPITVAVLRQELARCLGPSATGHEAD